MLNQNQSPLAFFSSIYLLGLSLIVSIVSEDVPKRNLFSWKTGEFEVLAIYIYINVNRHMQRAIALTTTVHTLLF